MANTEIEIKNALLRRALGYDYEEKVVEATKDGKQGKVRIFKKHVPPDVKALEKVLDEIRRGRW